jgi:GntR family transcriptional repressor for pyruvate dehydrogenase complex
MCCGARWWRFLTGLPDLTKLSPMVNRPTGRTTGPDVAATSEVATRLHPVRTARVYVEVVEQILQLVQEGYLSPGDRLPSERELASRLGVSRSSVREAMTALELLGTIQIKAGAGIFVGSQANGRLAEQVAALAKEGPLEILEARLIIEPGVARLAALRRSQTDLQDMRLQISKMASELNSGRNAWEPDWGFHEAIARAAQNPVLASMSDAMGQRMAHPMWTLMRSHNFEFAERAQRYLEDHRRILLAIEDGDGDAALKAMTRHISTILRDLGSRPAPGEPIT